MDLILSIGVLILSTIIHEVAHGAMAYRLGDPTAKYQGRLTLNPVSHIDPFGSVILPFLSYQLGGIIFGWAKPVPYNPYNLRDQRFGELKVAIVGPLSNLALAVIFGLVLRFAGSALPAAAGDALEIVVFVNLVLAVFNMIPVPPLDGSKVLFGLFPSAFQSFRETFERFGFVLVVFVVFFAWTFISPIIYGLFDLIVGP